MKSNKPPLKLLRNFAKNYYKGNPPTIRWKTMSALGMKLGGKNLIYINPNIAIEAAFGCSIGGWFGYTPKVNLKLKDGEQYFITLLHEIGHFKIKLAAPKEFYKLKEKVIQEIKEDEEIEQKYAPLYSIPVKKSKKYKSERAWLMAHLDQIRSFLDMPRKPGEEDPDYEGRRFEFESWLINDYVHEHIAVEDWAIQEFQKQREKINKLLSST